MHEHGPLSGLFHPICNPDGQVARRRSVLNIARNSNGTGYISAEDSITWPELGPIDPGLRLVDTSGG